jgi:predicted nucleic-acid-binding protein
VPGQVARNVWWAVAIPPRREAVLDANVLLRYLTDEPRELADLAAGILEAAEARRVALVVASLTLAEVVYVLGSVYHWSRNEIAERLLDLLSASALVVLEQDAIVQALEWYRDVPGLHFADAYVAALALIRGHGMVISFDRALRRVADITLVQDPGAI